ncbi:hypothetical protein U1Q18_025148, partial [Sarracenia purpurea var. burkii]
LGAIWGDAIEVEKNTSRRRDLELGRVLINTKKKETIGNHCQLRVGKFLYPIRCTKMGCVTNHVKSYGSVGEGTMSRGAEFVDQDHLSKDRVAMRGSMNSNQAQERGRVLGSHDCVKVNKAIFEEVELISRVVETVKGDGSEILNCSEKGETVTRMATIEVKGQLGSGGRGQEVSMDGI